MRTVLFAALLLVGVAASADVQITFRDGTVFQCQRIVQQDSRVVVVEQDGKRLSIQRKLIQSMEEIKTAPGPDAPKPADQPKTEQTNEDKLVLTDDNVERTVPRLRYPPEKETEEQQATEPPPVTISVISQQVSRSEGTVRFEGTARNDLTDVANNVQMTVQALDANGNVVASSTSRLAGSLAERATVPFSFQFADANNSISRFTFQFEAVIGGTPPQ